MGTIPFRIVGRDSGDPTTDEVCDAGGDGRGLWEGGESRGLPTVAIWRCSSSRGEVGTGYSSTRTRGRLAVRAVPNVLRDLESQNSRGQVVRVVEAVL